MIWKYTNISIDWLLQQRSIMELDIYAFGSQMQTNNTSDYCLQGQFSHRYLLFSS